MTGLPFFANKLNKFINGIFWGQFHLVAAPILQFVFVVSYLNFVKISCHFEVKIKVSVILHFQEDFNGVAERVESVVPCIFALDIPGIIFVIHDSDCQRVGQNNYGVFFQIFLDVIVERVFEFEVVVGIVLGIHKGLEIFYFNFEIVTGDLLRLLLLFC